MGKRKLTKHLVNHDGGGLVRTECGRLYKETTWKTWYTYSVDDTTCRDCLAANRIKQETSIVEEPVLVTTKVLVTDPKQPANTHEVIIQQAIHFDKVMRQFQTPKVSRQNDPRKRGKRNSWKKTGGPYGK